MKLFLAILLCLSSFAHASDSTSDAKIVTAQPAKDQLVSTKARSLFVELAGNGQTYNQGMFRLGMLFKEQWMVSGSYSRYYTQGSTAGGDLSTWNYVETNSSAKKEIYLLEATYFFFPVKASNSSPYVRFGVGEATQTTTYGYNRYKPYNGAICFIGPCDKAVEETDSGESDNSYSALALGAGYVWTVTAGSCGFHFRGGLSYMNIPTQTDVLGNNRKEIVDGIQNYPLSVEVGVGFDVPLF